MRNLKRALSLVLATVMVIGMMVVGASAVSYDDAADINYTEAVDVMTAIGMIKGIGNGDFAPTATIDRAGAAKLISYLMLGQKTADSIKAVENPFNDVDKNAWYAGYVSYCKAEKLLEGYNGNFDPNGTITAYGFAKLLLGALGYNAKIEGLTGDSWEVATAKLAINNGLFAGNDGALGNAALTRQEAALYAFNALKATKVYYAIPGTEITLSDGTTIVMGNSPWAVVAAKKDSNGKEITYTGTADKELQLCEDLYADLSVKTNAVDKFGRTVNEWSLGKDVIGQYVSNDASETVLVTKAGKSLTYWPQTIDKDYKAPAKVWSYGTSVNASTYTAKIGDQIEVYTDKDGVSKVVILTSELAKITKIAKTTDKDADFTYTVTLNIGGSNKAFTDNNLTGFNADLEKGDYVLVTRGNGVAILAEPEVVTGKKTATGSDYIKVDGEKYTESGRVWNIDDTDYTSTFDFFLDANGYIVGTEKVAEEKADVKVLYVTESNLVEGTGKFQEASAQLAVTYLDGTEAIVDMVIDKDGKINVDGKDTLIKEATVAPGFYGYTVNGDGEIKTLLPVAKVEDNTAADKAVFADGKANVKFDDTTTLYATSETTLTVINDGTAKTITGYKNFETATYNTAANAKPANKVDAILYVTDGKTLTAVYVLGGTVKETADAVYGWKVSVGEKYEIDGTKYTDVVYNVDGEDVTYRVLTNKVSALPTFATIEVTDDVAAMTAVKGAKTAVVEKVTDSYVLVDGGAVYFADDVVFYDVTNVADDGVLTTDSVEKNSNITYLTNSKGAITAVYITYAAQEDGVLTENDAAYIEKVLGFDKADAEGAVENDWVVIQYTREDDYKKVTLTVTDGKATVTTCTVNDVKAGIGGFMIDPVNDLNGAEGTFEYTIKNGAGAVLAVGSFEI